MTNVKQTGRKTTNSGEVFLFVQHIVLSGQNEGSGNIGTFIADPVEHGSNRLYTKDDRNRLRRNPHHSEQIGNTNNAATGNRWFINRHNANRNP